MKKLNNGDVDYCIRLGKIISALRKESGLTQEEIASKLDVSSNYISNLELGKSVFPVTLLRNYIHVLGKDPVIFLTLMEPDIVSYHASKSLISSINSLVEDLSKL